MKYFHYFALSNLNLMSISTTFFPKTDYHFFYNFLLVMSEEQIQKLRRVMIGIEKLSVFSDNEIEDLEKRAGLKTNLLSLA
jgi:hypothetical protein